MIKFLGSALLVLGGFLLARSLNSRAAKYLAVTDGWIRLIRYVKLQVECFSLPVSDIMSNVELSAFKECGYRRDILPKDMSELLEFCVGIEVESKKILTDFTTEFGRCYRAEQVKRCEYYIAALEERRDTMARQLPSKKKLNYTLCVAICLAAVIIFY